MEDESRFFYVPDFLNDCVDYDQGSGNGKVRDDHEVDIIRQLLQTGQSFNSEKGRELEIPHQHYQDSIKEPEEKPKILPEAPAAPAVVKEAPLSVPTKTKRNKALKHKCDTCSQVFDSRIALSIHSGRIHKSDGKDKNYQCHLCTKAFYNSSYLSQHMRIHTGHKPYECEVCPRKFTQLSHLQQHKRTHSGEKPYRCKQPGCSKAFSQLSNLQSHTRSHLPDGNVHKCTSCYKCYFDEASLNAHLRTHMVNKRIRNYKCEACGKTYTQDTYLQNHINNKHGGGSLEKMTYTPRPVARQPTSIQAATSMICKVEEQAQTCTNANLTSPLMQHVHAQGVMNKLRSSHPGDVGQSAAYASEVDYQRSAAALQSSFPPPARRQYEEHCSAFKPLPRPGLQGIESLTSQNRHRSMSAQAASLSTGYDQINNNILGLAATQEAKNAEAERHQEDTDMYWRIRNNMAAASLASYPAAALNSYSYASSYAAYINSPLESVYAAEKANSLYHADKSSSVFDSEAMSDYFIGGLREAYSLD